ncbi:MAG: diguanylate cyclase [Pyrinomonadaceae bacterium]|nr:diguanylate cyclase [Pyrinomonadaceae bacterium]
MFIALMERLGRRSRAFLITLGFLLVVLQSFLNYLAGPDFSVFLFYLLPISLIAWQAGRRMSILISLASTLGCFLVEHLSRPSSGRPLILFFNVAAKFSAFLFVAYFVSELRRSLEHERELARTDDLTGALNRRSFIEAATQEINRARRHRHPFTVAFMDIDDFKEVNNRLGHSAGDQLLHTVAGTIRDTIRDIDLIARLGGDEFVILLPETGQEAAQAVVSRVQQRIMEVTHEQRWPVSYSIGVVTWTTPPRTVDIMIKHADDAMYLVKNSGKNRVAHLNISGEPLPAA